MTKVTASISTSVDGYITGPDKGLGEGGERLHSRRRSPAWGP